MSYNYIYSSSGGDGFTFVILHFASSDGLMKMAGDAC